MRSLNHRQQSMRCPCIIRGAGPLPQDAHTRHAAEERLKARLLPFRQGLIRQELVEALLALFPCWTAVQCRAVLREPVFEAGDIAETVPPVRLSAPGSCACSSAARCSWFRLLVAASATFHACSSPFRHILRLCNV